MRTVVCTNGDKGTKDDISPFDLAKIREAEQLEASRILGVKETIFLRHRDGELEDTREFRNQIAFLIRHFKPDTILTHDPWRTHYQHPDHQAIGHATFKAVVYARDHHFLPELTYAGIKAHHTNTSPLPELAANRISSWTFPRPSIRKSAQCARTSVRSKTQ